MKFSNAMNLLLWLQVTIQAYWRCAHDTEVEGGREGKIENNEQIMMNFRSIQGRDAFTLCAFLAFDQRNCKRLRKYPFVFISHEPLLSDHIYILNNFLFKLSKMLGRIACPKNRLYSFFSKNRQLQTAVYHQYA